MTNVTVGTYHHGDLPNALRKAAADVIIEKGLGAFSLREVARRAGVSHAAPAHHFGDVRGLLTSLAAEGFTYLEAALRESQDGLTDPEARLAAMGRAYVRMGITYPGHCAVMFRHDLIDDADLALQGCGYEAFQRLEDLIVDIREIEGADFDLGDATKLCWAAMQGLIVLWSSMQDIEEARGYRSRDADAVVARFARMLLDGMRPRPTPNSA